MQVNIKNVKKIIGDRILLNIDELKLESGKIYGIVGPNGAGKSTLLRILSGLDNEFQGDVLYSNNKHKLAGFEKVKGDIAMLHQKPYVFNMTVKQNVELGIKLNGRENDEVVNRIIDNLYLTDIKDKNALRISGGESQRTVLGRLLALEPELLLLDEPTSNADPENTRTIENAITELKKDLQRTIVLVTHNIFQSLRLCDFIIYMEKGNAIEVIDKNKAHESKKIKELIEYTSQIG